MGERAGNACYSHYEVFGSLLGMTLGGGSCLEDLQYLRRTHKDALPMRICSPDTAAYALKELAVEDHLVLSERSCHLFNRNNKLNRLLISTAKNLGMIKKVIDLDVDGKVFECGKKDAKGTYTGTVGYQPMMAFSGRIPLYIEGRNGNTNASFCMHLMLRDCFTKLREENIQVDRLRIDAAGCQYKVIKEVKNNCRSFFIRCSDVLHHLQGQELHWEKVTIGQREIEVAQGQWKHPGYKKPFRLVVERNQDIREQTNIFTGESYIYRGIITNHTAMTPQQVIQYYNGRGAAERNFDFLGNDFNLNHLPFSSMKMNMVYMAAMAWCAIVFEYLKTTLRKRFGKNVIKWRLKQFIYRYVIHPFRLTKHARKITVQFAPGYT